MKRYILSVREEARIQYQVEAESPADVRRIYERGEVGNPLIDEHYEAEIISIDEIGDVMDYELADAKGRPDTIHPRGKRYREIGAQRKAHNQRLHDGAA